MKYTILIIDDEMSIREALTEILEDHFGHECQCFHVGTAEEGLLFTQEKMPNLVMTDILLPKMNGIDLTRRIRALNKKIPVIVFTGGGEGDGIVKQVLLEAATSFGAVSALAKPFDIPAVIRTVEAALNLSAE
ncbi:MAG: hypothetical protein A2X86_18120 [Bdellovibrionales bacterium GWA2_49_15]|nr:MAG: hypothetical protein A2X86_18120 [Bdellovibrionales bacterium GWA2_49_15]HAZ11641.1 hypothetical protein [Bdellovibrionales bacterium]